MAKRSFVKRFPLKHYLEISYTRSEIFIQQFERKFI